MNVQGFLLQDQTGQEYLVSFLPLSGSKLFSLTIHYRQDDVWKPFSKRSAAYASVQAKAMAALTKFAIEVGSDHIAHTAHSASRESEE